jgi:4-hydroxy-tetrahydrodipicolinate synthase
MEPSAFVISITPFDEQGRVDEPALRRHLQRLAAAGVGVYVGGGGSGEGYTLSPDEKRRLLAIAVEELKGKVPVRAMGTEPRTAAEMIEFARMAEASGVDAIQIYSLDVGHGHAPTPQESEAYFSEVLGAIRTPCVLSTHQSVGYVIPAAVIGGLVRRYDQVIGVNCSHQDLSYLAGIIDSVKGRASVHVGGPMQAAICLAFGGQGFLSSEGNLAPTLCQSVIRHHVAGDHAAFLDAFGRIVRLSTGLYGNGGIRVTKAVLGQLGLPGGYPRKPRLPVTDERLDRAMKLVEDLAIRQSEGL